MYGHNANYYPNSCFYDGTWYQTPAKTFKKVLGEYYLNT